jgi:hypothetical protein
VNFDFKFKLKKPFIKTTEEELFKKSFYDIFEKIFFMLKNDFLLREKYLEQEEKIKIELESRKSFKKKHFGGHFNENGKYIFKTTELRTELVLLMFNLAPSLKLLKTKQEIYLDFKNHNPNLKDAAESPNTDDVSNYLHLRRLNQYCESVYYGFQDVSYWEIDSVEYNDFSQSEALKDKELKKNNFDLITLLENVISKLIVNIDDGAIKLLLMKYNTSFLNIFLSLNETSNNKLPLSNEAFKTLEVILKDFSFTILDRCEKITIEKKDIETLENEAKQKMYSEIIAFELDFQKENLL